MELAMARVVRGLPAPRFAHSVACLSGVALIAKDFGPAAAIYSLNGDSDPLRQLWRLRCLIQDLKPSVIHARNISAWLDLAIARVTLRDPFPVVLSFHGTDHAGPLPAWYRVIAALAARSATHLFTVSEQSRELLVRSLGLAKTRIGIIPNGIDTTTFIPNTGRFPQQKRVVVGTVGNLSPVKNQTLLVRACAQLLGCGYDVELRIAGEGRERARIMEAASLLGVSRSVHLLGHVDDVPSFLRTLDLFVLSSDSEAHPNALIEAMACALPCIGSRVGGIPDVLADDSVGRLFDAGDLSGLVAAMTELITAPETRGPLGRRARKRVEERYTVEEMIRRYADLYSEIAGR